MKKKTLKQWEKSNLDLDKFLFEPCEIDEEMFNWIGEIISPQYLGEGIVQGGDCDRHVDGVGFYATAYHDSQFNTYFYLGILPEFKQ